jgi:hypothetical protein
MISPSFRTLLLGIPWTTSSSIDTHNVPGNPYKPLNPGIALFLIIKFSAILSNSRVVIPGLTYSSTKYKVSFTICPARFVFSI